MTIAVFEDEPRALTAISFSDVDAGTNEVTATFSVATGTLSATSGGGVTVGGSSSELTLSGAINDINTFISAGNLKFTTALNSTSDVTLAINISDNGNTGSGGVQTDQATVTIEVTAVNDAPVNSVPGNQQTDQDVALVFSSGNGNLISVSDVDAGGAIIKISLTATNGLITLSGTTGLSFNTGTGVNDASIDFAGTITAINSALSGMTFNPIQGYSGSATLTIISDDQGFSGSGGTKTDTDIIEITVNSINPVVTSVTSSTANGLYKAGDEISIQVIFDQPVIVNSTGGLPTLTLETGSVDRAASYVSGSGTTTLNFSYTVQAGDASEDLDYASINALILNGAVIENSTNDPAILQLPAVGSANSLSGQKKSDNRYIKSGDIRCFCASKWGICYRPELGFRCKLLGSCGSLRYSTIKSYNWGKYSSGKLSIRFRFQCFGFQVYCTKRRLGSQWNHCRDFVPEYWNHPRCGRKQCKPYSQ
ncbi:hypothetical protein [Algoriphagus boritolerans]|uniref:hypothetical protein n=1 Tax=Algoriphagus boritolerans TaxID=308111 RepID=UPI000AEB5D96